MQSKKSGFIFSLTVMLALLLIASPLWAGGNEDPPTTGTIVGPELWGVLVYDCDLSGLVLRVKRIVDCNVETQALYDDTYNTGCAGDETSFLWRKLGVPLFDINPDPTVMDPIITNVKNYKKEPGRGLFSMDVQIKFWTP